MDNINSLQQRLNKIEKELEKVRGCSPLTHGWQTQRYAKASRKWDMLSLRKMDILNRIELCTSEKHTYKNLIYYT
jgi:predicted secreted hydrolase